jgi:hypothetical protein
MLEGNVMFDAKTLLAAAVLSGAALFGAASASAMPIAGQPGMESATIENVAYGCGPGWHPGPYGRCVPNRGPRFVRPIYRRPPPRHWRRGW